jgi:hypothetical protein
MGTLSRVIDEFIHSPVEVLAALVVIVTAISPAFNAGRRGDCLSTPDPNG